tara:strand:+ start:263 stop:784 length:522 start_codon:yes stop_codon:yes gene_type:complete
MGGLFSKQSIDTEKNVILTMRPEYYVDNSKEYFSDTRPADTYRWDGSLIESVEFGVPYTIKKKDKVTKKMYEDYFKKFLKKNHSYLFAEGKDLTRHKKIKLLNVSKKQNKIVATYTYTIEGVDFKWEEFRLQEGLSATTRSGDPIFFKKINGKKIYVRFVWNNKSDTTVTLTQ